MDNRELIETKLEEKRSLVQKMRCLEGSEKRRAEERVYQLRRELAEIESGVFAAKNEINSIRGKYKFGEQISSDDMERLQEQHKKIAQAQHADNVRRNSIGLFINK